MKIYGTMAPIETSPPAGNSSTTCGVTSGAFAELLKKVVAQSTEDTCKPKATGETTSTEPATAGAAQTASPLLDQLTSVLDLMEQFAAGLGDLSMTPKDLEPMAEKMQSLLDEVKSGLGPEVDEDLNRLAQEVNAQAQAEIFKFRRGDYV